MTQTAATCWTPKSTDSDAAPAAAATVNSQAGAGGAWEIAMMASLAAGGAESYARRSEVHHAVEHMRPRHENHARADRYEA